MSLRSVRKRDGSEVPYDKGRIQAAVAAAQAAVGEDDEGFAGEVANLVDFALRRRYAMDGTGPEGWGAPDVEEIQDLVETALVQLGRAEVAKAYILYRDRRARVREARTLGREDNTDPALLKTLRVRETEGSSPWSKGRIIAALVDEAGLSRTLAEEVSVRVEKRVVRSGLKRISTALVRELVDNELVAMGLSTALARHEPVSIPRHDLRQLLELGPGAEASAAAPRWLAGRRLGEDAVDAAIAGEILRRFALEDVLEERSVELASAGEIHVEDLRRPHLHLVQSVPCDLLVRGEPGSRSAFELLDELAALAASVSHGVVLEAPGTLLQPLLRGGRSEATGGLGAWLLALRALARASGRRIDLSRLGARSPALIARLIEELDELAAPEHGGGEPEPLPRLFLDREELRAAIEHRTAQHGLEAARDSLERLLDAGLVVPCWSRADELFAGPGCRRRGREQGALACGGAVSLNLARAARRAGPWREDLALEELARLAEAGVEALAQLSRFQRRARAARAGEARGRVAYALTPVGLREALRVLGDGEVRPAQGARLLGLLSEAARRFASQRGLSVVLTPYFGARAARRFARVDAAEPRVSQHLLFGELARGLAGSTTALSAGFDLGSPAERFAAEPPGEAEAELLATVPTGAWIPPARGMGHPRAVSSLEAWERFDQLREERRAGAAPSTASPSPSPSDHPALFPTP